MKVLMMCECCVARKLVSDDVQWLDHVFVKCFDQRAEALGFWHVNHPKSHAVDLRTVLHNTLRL